MLAGKKGGGGWGSTEVGTTRSRREAEGFLVPGGGHCSGGCGDADMVWLWVDVEVEWGCGEVEVLQERELMVACGHSAGLSRIRYALLETQED